MADGNDIHVTSHAVENFDPEQYVQFYKMFNPDSPVAVLRSVKFIMDQLHDIFKDGEITGDRLLEIGSGPGCHTVYSASKWFKVVTLSDPFESSLNVLREWKAGNRRDIYEQLYKYLVGLDGNSEDWATANQRVAEKVKFIVRGDLRQDKVLAGTELENETFDTIVLPMCQNAAHSSRQEYSDGVAKYTKQLKAGGYVIVVDGLDVSYYTIGKKKFLLVKLTKDELQSIYRENGLEILRWTESDDVTHPATAKMSDIRAVYVMVCRKR